MKDYYRILGLNSSATALEVRRAYRVLARRYHPDVNPGKVSEEKFKDIAQAYETLSDIDKRRTYDIQYESAQRDKVDPRIKNYQREQRAREQFFRSHTQPSARSERNRPQSEKNFAFDLRSMAGKVTRAVSSTIEDLIKNKSARPNGPREISIIEASVSMHDAILGVKKTVEILEPERTRKISVKMPAGIRTGSVLRLRPKDNPDEEVVLIIRVASHPYLNIQAKGLIVEVPLSLREAMYGASITLPTLEDQVIVKVQPGTQSGSEVRLKGKGIIQRDGTRGDLFLRFLVKTPTVLDASGLKEKVCEFEKFYSEDVRRNFPKTLLERE